MITLSLKTKTSTKSKTPYLNSAVTGGSCWPHKYFLKSLSSIQKERERPYMYHFNMIELCSLVFLYEDLCFDEADAIIATCSLFYSCNS